MVVGGLLSRYGRIDKNQLKHEVVLEVQQCFCLVLYVCSSYFFSSSSVFFSFQLGSKTTKSLARAKVKYLIKIEATVPI